VLRHSAGGVRLLYVVCIIRNAHALLTYSSVNIFIALGWSSENDFTMVAISIRVLAKGKLTRMYSWKAYPHASSS